MSIEGLTPQVIEAFKGVQTLPDALDVELGNATDSKNVEYHLGTSVASRSGRSRFLTLIGNPNIVSMAEYALLDGVTRRLMILGSDGSLSKENGDLTLTTVETGLGPSTRVAQQTMFGRQYMAFSDGKLATGPPRYYDDKKFYRVSQGGPGAAPTLAYGGAGTVTKGLHYVRVIFEFADASRSAPSIAASITMDGAHAIKVSDLTCGPSNVVRRIICCSAAITNTAITPDGLSYFFIPNTSMVVNDNTTREVVIDFTDAQLTAAEDVTNLLFNFVLPGQAGVIAFSSRLVWWGGQNSQYRVADNGLRNQDFDGGFQSPTVFGKVPLGWQALHPGCDVVDNVPGATGTVFRIVADGANQVGTIANRVVGKDLGSIIRPNVAYGGRMRVRKSPGLAQGSVSLYFLQQGSVVVGGAGALTVDSSQISTDWREFTGLIYPATEGIADDLVLKVSGGKGNDGFTTILAPAGEYIDVDFVAIYEMTQPYTPSLLYLSEAGQPAYYNGNGLINIAENNGQAIRQCFAIRNHLFVCKENSTFAITDTQDDPINWPVSEVVTAGPDPQSVGTPSENGVGMGEGWVVIAARSGLYYFDGGFPQKISEEIQPTWDRINWAVGHLIVVRVDTEQKRIFVQVPMDGATDINQTLYCDWTGPNPMYGAQFGSLGSRNWCPNWTTPASSMAVSRRSDGTLALLFGTNDGTGRILRLDGSLHQDDGQPFESFYRTAYGGGPSGRNSFQYLTASVFGSGTLSMQAIYPDQVTAKGLLDLSLQNQPNRDVEWRGLRVNGERIAWQFGTNAADDWFKMRKLVAYGRRHPWAPTLGSQT